MALVAVLALVVLGLIAVLSQRRPPAPTIDPSPSETSATASPLQTPTRSATPAPSGPDPLADLTLYYELIDGDRFKEAYALRSQRSRARTSLAEFTATWSNNNGLSVESLEVLKRDAAHLLEVRWAGRADTWGLHSATVRPRSAARSRGQRRGAGGRWRRRCGALPLVLFFLRF
ncbi:hypothetical protein DYH09_29545, partial [bacterium CPR1]|nr:hypothetical protein [bacterium CPR1]